MFASIAACARGAFACAGSMQGGVINLADRALLLLVVLVWGRGAASVAKWRVRRVQGRGVCSCECAERAAVAIMMVTMLKKKSRETLFQCCRAAEGRVRAFVGCRSTAATRRQACARNALKTRGVTASLTL